VRGTVRVSTRFTKRSKRAPARESRDGSCVHTCVYMYVFACALSLPSATLTSGFFFSSEDQPIKPDLDRVKRQKKKPSTDPDDDVPPGERSRTYRFLECQRHITVTPQSHRSHTTVSPQSHHSHITVTHTVTSHTVTPHTVTPQPYHSHITVSDQV